MRRKIPSITSLIFFAFIMTTSLDAYLGEKNPVVFKPSDNCIPLVVDGKAISIVTESSDWAGVVRAAKDLQSDFNRVTEITPSFTESLPNGKRTLILIGTVGKSSLIDKLIKNKKIDVSKIQGQWESWLTCTVEKPFPGIDSALVIAGSDKRGSIYGIYNLSQQIGVSPWYWWADATPQKHTTLYFTKGCYLQGPPVVKYRGFFINDEAPALSSWANERFGGLNSDFYAHVFELLLRLRAYYLWPAMWNNAFNTDDPENPRLADEYGIVMGTSHHEPMMRSQQEWIRTGEGEWNYESNEENLNKFWRKGIHRNRNYENMTTIGMRGDGDVAMSETANIHLLEKIVADQRKILSEETGKKAEEIPQMWALYKEVQEYYEKGMRVPDDVTLLWCDDNYGNIRRLPTTEEQKRSGGAGIYYHVDYVGWPRCYKWLNTSPITKIWEQMQMAWKYKADRIWILNVGDIKPMEFPIEFFMTYAWNPEKWPYENLKEYTRLWAEREFGEQYSAEIANLISGYTKYNNCVKPEYLSKDTFSLVNYNEAESVSKKWQNLINKAENIYSQLPEEKKASFFQLVLWPVKASGVVSQLNIAAGYNKLYAYQGRVAANNLVKQVENLFQEEADLTTEYNEILSDGKWKHMADQTHIGYTFWQQPPLNTMPSVAKVQPKRKAEIAVSVEGLHPAWPEFVWGEKRPVLPVIDSTGNQTRWIDIFNRGILTASYTVEANVPWLKLSSTHGMIPSTGSASKRVYVSVDWDKIPQGDHTAMINIQGEGINAGIQVPVKNFGKITPEKSCYVESGNYVCIEAPHYSRAISDGEIEWKTLEDYGRTLGGVKAFPVNIQSRTLSKKSPRLEYDFYTTSSGEAQIDLYLSTTLAFNPEHGLRLAVSIDSEKPEIIDLKFPVGDAQVDWGKTVYEAIRKTSTKTKIDATGLHTLKLWMIDPGVMIQRVLISFATVRDSYFGPPESPYYSK